MSMILGLKRATDQQIDKLLHDPDTILDFLDSDETGTRSTDEIDLDKAWHGLHYLLTGTDWKGEEPWCYLLSGGTPVGDVDVGYGPARALRSAEVAAFAQALGSITPDELRRRFDPRAMTSLRIYPTIWHRCPDEDDTLGYLVQYFELLKPFVQETAQRGLGLVIAVS
jgi:hypothetical protein